MSRGIRKQIDYDEEVKRIENQISKYRKRIEDLETDKQNLINQKEAETLKLINTYIKQSGFSLEEAMEILKAARTESAAS